MSKSLVTGGAGFIGSTLVEALLKRGEKVCVLDNFSTGKRRNLSEVNGRLEILEADLRDQAALERAVKGVDIVFHEAALVSVPLSMNNPEICDAINVHGTLNLLSAAQRAGVRRVVIASSAAVYGDSTSLPLQENQKLTPLSPYAISKQVNELYADLYFRIYGLETVCLRYFNVYGPRQSPDSDYAAAIPIFIREMLADNSPTIFGDGNQGRDFIFVEDVVDANLKAAQVAEAKGKIYNICSGKDIRIIDLIHSLNRVLKSNIQAKFDPPRQGDIYRSLGDPSRAHSEIGFTPQINLDEGLALTAAWMQHG